MLHSSPAMPHSISPLHPYTPQRQINESFQFALQQIPQYQPIQDRTGVNLGAQQAQTWQQPRVHPAYILTSNNTRPTSAPIQMQDTNMTDGMPTPLSAAPLTPAWTHHGEDVANGNAWRAAMPTSHPTSAVTACNPYSPVSPAIYDTQSFADYSAYTTHNRQWSMNNAMMSPQQRPILHTAPPTEYYPSNMTLAASWSPEMRDDISHIASDYSGMRSASPHSSTSPPVGLGISLGGSATVSSPSLKRRRAVSTEDTRCQCDICGKFFQRAYNLRAHKETHNPARSQPFECEYADCDKRFVRKTDLSRHIKSVHVQTREHSCGQCGARFARKDTMRRHALDGCPARLKTNKKHVQKSAFFESDGMISPLSALEMSESRMLSGLTG